MRRQWCRMGQEIWKDKKRWESANFQKCEFGPHYVRMLGAKYGVAGNTTGVGSLMILEYVYSLIVCVVVGQERRPHSS